MNIKLVSDCYPTAAKCLLAEGSLARLVAAQVWPARIPLLRAGSELGRYKSASIQPRTNPPKFNKSKQITLLRHTALNEPMDNLARGAVCEVMSQEKKWRAPKEIRPSASTPAFKIPNPALATLIAPNYNRCSGAFGVLEKSSIKDPTIFREINDSQKEKNMLISRKIAHRTRSK